MDVAFGDGVLWNGLPWQVTSMHYRANDGVTEVASLIRWGNNIEQPAEAYAPVKDLRVFKDAEPYGYEDVTIV